MKKNDNPPTYRPNNLPASTDARHQMASQTKYHKLNNLIWVWSAQNADWYVGDKYCDVLSCDVYDDGNKDAQVNIMLFLQSISKNKPIAMSECGSFPDIQSIADEKAMWAFIGQWGGNYLMTDDGKLAEENNTAAVIHRSLLACCACSCRGFCH